MHFKDSLFDFLEEENPYRAGGEIKKCMETTGSSFYSLVPMPMITQKESPDSKKERSSSRTRMKNYGRWYLKPRDFSRKLVNARKASEPTEIPPKDEEEEDES